MLYQHKATIEVRRGRFPVDMLRYDSCYPASGEDVNKIEQSLDDHDFRRGPYQVTVHAMSRNKEHWTPARWKSFGAVLVATRAQKA